jgi:hypothetical protein
MRGEVMRLNQQLKEANAKEFTMDSATKQNSELLKLLKKAEEETEAVCVRSFCQPRFALCALTALALSPL